MTLNEFAGEVRDMVVAECGDGHSIEVTDTLKNNSVRYTGISIREQGSKVAPVIYLNDYYLSHCDGVSITAIVDEVINTYRENKELDEVNVENLNDYGWARYRIVYRLINYDRNKELLSGVPHRRFLDLAVVYTVSVGRIRDGFASTMVRNEHMELWGKDEEDLWRHAMENTPRLNLPETINLVELLKELMGDAFPEYAEDELDIMKNAFVISNVNRTYGAACILYDGLMEGEVERMGEDVYILPSSVHEVIIVPKSGIQVETLLDMVREVNDTQVSKVDLLSYSVYETVGGKVGIAFPAGNRPAMAAS